jgi:tetratricopeptide (TPR) repeat protein
MSSGSVFVSHTSKDDSFVAELRRELQRHGVEVWVDSREMAGGDPLDADVRAAIEAATAFVVVLSPAAVGSAWVAREIRHAVKTRKRNEGYRVVPLLLPGIEPKALERWFKKEPVAVPVPAGVGGLQEAMPRILQALGMRAPDDPTPPTEAVAAPVVDLVLALEDPAIELADGKRRAVARARLVYTAGDAGGGKVGSLPFRLMAPIGPIEAGEIAWYLERYCRWPSELFRTRARQVEEALPRWGQSLYRLLEQPAGDREGTEALRSWQKADRVGGREVVRRFSVDLDPRPPLGIEGAAAAERAEAATLLLSIPWELLHDGTEYLFQGARPARVRRRLPRKSSGDPLVTDPPLRVLLVSPRPEDRHAGSLDHRVSARALVDALAPLGDLVELRMLETPTRPGLEAELARARKAGQPYHVLHFDGHGVYDRRHGLGALCFEDPADGDKLIGRQTKLVHATELAGMLRDHRVPLVFLEACQTAMTEEDPAASVAGCLLEHGVSSVVAMSHSVLVETARRFVAAFYTCLVEGGRVGEAMLAGQQTLYSDPVRGRAFEGALRLQDWFVPVLYQEEADIQLVRRLPGAAAQAVVDEGRERALGELPEPAKHSFVGRSRELLAAERLLARQPYIVLRGEGGEGKTALAAELARWLVESHRFRRAAFVTLETHLEARGVLDTLGRQLVPGYAVAAHPDLDKARQPVLRTLAEVPTVIVVDNAESVLEPPPGSPGGAAFDPESLEDLLGLLSDLGSAGHTRLVWTSREGLPAPFGGNEIPIGRLERGEAISLVARVLGEGKQVPRPEDAGESEAQVEALVDAVACHARSLVLLAPDVARAGVRVTTDRLRELMARLEFHHPGERERSLLASVELSLRRLPAGLRERIGALGVFRGGAHRVAMAMVLEMEDQSEAEPLVKALVGVGLAARMPYGYVRFDPALGPSLWAELDDPAQQRALARWVEVMGVMTHALYERLFKDAERALALTALDLANLLGALETQAEQGDAEQLVSVATRLEQLVQPLGRSRTLSAVVAVRERAARRLDAWSHSRFEAERAAVERLTERGRHREASAAARTLLERALAAGEQPYPGAAYDVAVAHVVTGRALLNSGAVGEALPLLGEARRRFQELGDAGDAHAMRMVSVSVTDFADCLMNLGQLEDAAAAYEEGIRIAEKLQDARAVAVGRGQLGDVRRRQRRFREALAALLEAKDTFERLGEPRSVAVVWHQIGMIHGGAGQPEAAEHAYQESLKIETMLDNAGGEATTLVGLGNLYAGQGRHEDAVRFYRQAADVFASLGDLARESRARRNTADELIDLARTDEARTEIVRAIACNELFGHAAEPWTTFATLSILETTVGNAAAAAAARQRALDAYLAYRRDGGETTTPAGEICALVQAALASADVARVTARLDQLAAAPSLPAGARAVTSALRQIIAGRRDPAMADDPALDYRDAAEVLLLVESLPP